MRMIPGVRHVPGSSALRWFEKRVDTDPRARHGTVFYSLRREVDGAVYAYGYAANLGMPRDAIAWGLWRARLQFRRNLVKYAEVAAAQV